MHVFGQGEHANSIQKEPCLIQILNPYSYTHFFIANERFHIFNNYWGFYNYYFNGSFIILAKIVAALPTLLKTVIYLLCFTL